MALYARFGKLLTEGIKHVTLARHWSVQKTYDWLAEDLGVSDSTIRGWGRGERLPDVQIIPKLARIFVKEWQADQKWINNFLDGADYGPVPHVEALNQELFGCSRGNNLNPEYLDWGGQISVRFDQLTQIAARQGGISIMGFLIICLVGWWLVQPFVAQPFATPQIAFEASLSYGLAVLILPLLIGLLAGEATQAAFQPSKQTKWPQLWSIYCFNAYAGYYVLTIFCLMGALTAYAFGLWPWPALLQLFLLVVPPLLFAYATARYRTAKIIRNQPEKLSQYISISKLLLAVFAALNLLIPIALYGVYLILFDLSLSLQQDLFLSTLATWLPHSWPYLPVGLLTLLGAGVALMLTKQDKKPGQTRSGWILFIISVALFLSAMILVVVIQAS